MTFDEFKESCSFDIVENPDSLGEDDEFRVLCIFSSGFMKEHPRKFIDEYPELAKDLAAWTLYESLKKRFSNGS